MRWDDETIQRRAELVRKLKSITQSDDLTKYAIAFVLSYPEVTVVIPGVKTEEQLHDHIRNADFKLDKEMKKEIISFYEKEIKDDPLPW